MSINSSEESLQNLSAIKVADNHLISIVVPVYNEELCIEEMIIRLDALKEKMSSIVQLEFIFVNDGSVDKTGELLKLHAEIKPYLKLVELSRNFGHQIAVTAGIDVSKGDFIVIIDGDLQDPPELIEQRDLT
jgi:dolichol-phosphate mannosyltransferase